MPKKNNTQTNIQTNIQTNNKDAEEIPTQEKNIQEKNGSTQKVIELYLETLKEYKIKYNKEKLIVFMQVGSFLEIYGIIYPDGTRVGDIWEFCDNVNLNIGLKKQEVYKNPDIKAYMAGTLIQHADPYIQKGVEKFGWTIVIFEQNKIGNTNKYERVETATISPGININSDSYSNISMVIYMEQVKKYYKPNKISPNELNIGVSFIDCISGNNGILSINNSSIADISIPFDELLKLLTIKNPKELTIYVQHIEDEKLSNDDIINALHLFNYQFKIIREEINEKYMNLNYQNNLLNTVYNKYRGLSDISQQLDMDSSAHYYTRIALCLLLDFILMHDKTILQKLDKPEIILNSDTYLMLANNSLEQLDIIDNLKSDSQNSKNSQNSKRISLLDLLDNTKTPLGKNLFRNRICTPITDNVELQKRYKTIKEFETLHNNYMKKNKVSSMNDKYGSPLHQVRHHLSGIKNIDNYLRKIITGNISPGDIGIYINSLHKCINLYEYINGVISSETLCGNTNTNSKSNSNINQKQIEELQLLIPDTSVFQSLTEIHTLLSESIIFENISCNIWGDVENNPLKKGISKILDDLQMEIESDRTLLDNLVIELSSIVEPKFNRELYNTENYKAVICIGDNASKGIHIHTTKAKKDSLEDYFTKKLNTIKIGKYTITNKDIKFIQVKDNKWEIDIIYLKSSNGTLKVNIDKMGRTVKGEIVKWLQTKLVNISDQDKENITSSTSINTLLTFAKFIAEIDVVQSNVLNVVEKGYVEPIIDMSHSHSFVKAEKMRHPIIEHISKTTKYIPNDIILGIDGIDGMLLFGVNAVGKSSLMKSIGINIIMAQAGMYVASSSFVYKPYKYLFTRIRNNDNIYAGLSSFEVEMKEFKVILKYANEDSIILGDELCSGTETQDATALVASGVSNLSKRKSSFMFATHLHFLADMSYIKELNNVKLFHLLVERDEKDPTKLIYTRTLQPGNGPKSYGILVCETMDLDRDFITKAKEIRESMNSMKSYHNLNLHHNPQTNSIVSKYNINKIISLCEICKIANACDVHHINQQCDANENNIINDNEHGIFNKNKLWNLVSLCKECHQSIHSSPPRITIEGYVTTTDGVELKWQTAFQKSRAKIEDNIDINFINNFIVSSKNSGLSAKKIQYDLKRNYNYETSQQNIRDIKLSF